MAAASAASPRRAKEGSELQRSHLRLERGGCTEVLSSPCGRDFTVEVKSMVAAAGAGISGGPGRLQRDGVAPQTRRSPRAELCVAASTDAPTACERTASPRKPPPRGTHSLPALHGAGCLVGPLGPRLQCWEFGKGATQVLTRRGLRAPNPDVLTPRPRRTWRVGPEPQAPPSSAKPGAGPPGCRRSDAASPALEGVSRQQQKNASTARRWKRLVTLGTSGRRKNAPRLNLTRL